MDEQNDKGFCPLHLAANSKKLSVVELLLKHNAKIDVLDGDGRTALMCAVSGLEIFETLVSPGSTAYQKKNTQKGYKEMNFLITIAMLGKKLL